MQTRAWFTRIAAILALALAAGFAAAPARAQQVVDEVVASVDGNPITMRDVMDFAAMNGNPVQPGDLAGSPAAKAALKSLIEERLLEQEVKKYADKVDDDQVTQYIRELRNDRHMSQAQFDASLKANGVSQEELRRRARLDLEKALMIQDEVREKINVPESGMKAYYDDHSAEFTIAQERYQLAQILIAAPKSATPAQAAAAEKKAAMVHALALKGKDFGALARRYSDDDSKTSGGELGWFKPSEIMNQILAGIKGLKPGQISPVIRSVHGFHIVKVEDHEMPGVLPFAAVKDRIRTKLLNQAAQARLQTWVETDLVKQHYVETLY
ncbi:MAG: peptidylprolyl isomerase [Candidatus Binataceae bacterium]